MKAHLKTWLATALVLGLGAAAPAAANEQLEQRVSNLEGMIQGGALAGMVNQMEQLRREVQLLRGDLELVQRELNELKQRHRDLYQDNDRRIRALEETDQRAAEPSGSLPPSGASDAGTEGTSTSPTTGLNLGLATGPEREGERDAYQEAFEVLRGGDYPAAADAFQGFLERYPTGRFTDNGLYWLGESYYAQRDFGQAAQHFQTLLDSMPGSAKYPDALLKLGFIHHERQELDQAREILERLREELPDSTAANLATQRLERIREEQS